MQLLIHNVQAEQNPYADLAQEALDDVSDQATEALRIVASEMTLDDAIALASVDRVD